MTWQVTSTGGLESAGKFRQSSGRSGAEAGRNGAPEPVGSGGNGVVEDKQLGTEPPESELGRKKVDDVNGKIC